jgi:hypothetical protein
MGDAFKLLFVLAYFGFFSLIGGFIWLVWHLIQWIIEAA